MLNVSTRALGRTSPKRAFATFPKSRQDVRPATAPKQTPDLKSIRTAPAVYEQNTVFRNYTKHQEFPRRIVELSETSSSLAKSIADTRRKLKALEQQLGAAKATKDEAVARDVHSKIAPLRRTVDEVEVAQAQCDDDIRALALALPNLTSSHTPTNNQEKVIGYLNYDENNPPSFAEGADHSIIGQNLDLIDFASASATTGWGFYYLLNEAALLEQALVQYALSVALQYGWRMVTPPSLVYSHIADSCGFQPRDANDEQQIWQVAQPEKDVGKPKRSLAATAEIPLAALYAGKDIPQQDLPIKLVGSSRCYRAEAGARGVGTKGLYRVHEFTKVEMFAWSDSPSTFDKPDWTAASTTIFEQMVEIQTQILKSLDLPCRILEMPSSDLGASAYRKIDIEALFPSRLARDGGWGEVTSVSICTDYQSRRLDTRIKEKSGARSRFPHTVNGTALAIPRVLAAILENGWRDQEGIVIIPKVLVPYMGGLTEIGPSGKRI